MATTTTYPSPSESAEQSRDEPSQTEENDDSGPMSIEHSTYRRDRYSSSSTAFPFPLPMITRSLRADLQKRLTPSAELRKEISKVLRGNHVEVVLDISMCGQSKRRYPNGQSRICS